MNGPSESRRPSEQPAVHSGEDARGGEIILRTRLRKVIFFGGLIGFVALVIALSLLRLVTG